MTAMMVIFFAVSISSCKKEAEIAPVNPIIPQVSFNPKSIITRNDAGSVIQTEQFHYDAQNVLTSYSRRNSSGTDTASLFGNFIRFQTLGGQKEIQNILPDKSLGNIDISVEKKIIVEKSGDNFLDKTIKQFGAFFIPVTSSFNYASGSVSRIATDNEVIEITYNNNITYQKGINEIPFSVATVNKFKVLELGNATSTKLYSKLIQSVVIKVNGAVKEEHQYGYRKDANGRITEVTQRSVIAVNTFLSNILTVKKEIVY
jgi:hypothetical protein